MATKSANRLVIDADSSGQTISRHIYGHFAEHLGRCIYEGIWVGEDSPIPNTRGIRNDVVAALRKIRIPNLRWPGGCFADTYHWMDGIGARAKRPSIVNVHWGGVTENNHFGTHEFFDLCAQLGCEPYVCGNVGSGTVREMAEWLEYITMPGQSPMSDLRRKHGQKAPWKLRYWGVGNENWGCGGNMRPEYYADEYKRYACFCRNFAGDSLYKIACGANCWDFRWTEVLMREACRHMDGLSLHYYCGSGGENRSATQFGEKEWWHQLLHAWRLEALLRRHVAIMDSFDPTGRVGLILDEWGTWHAVEPGTNPGFLYQQNSLRDALVTGISLNLMNRYSARLRMANIAQTINVLQAMCLTEGEKMILTPTYHVFEMYAVHHDAALLPAELATATRPCEKEALPVVQVSASRDAAGRVNLTFCNLDPESAQEVSVEVRGMSVKKISGRTLTAAEVTAHNTFERPDAVAPVDEVEAKRLKAGGLAVKLPSKSVVLVTVE
ncbi:MAG: alpha-N-arabinofuranosidase [Lentisphaerae bacterium RIFOXYB12_FULL_65_16]|nr:MAG: alpha-N-arabinofuranosidase [Lentisphaerae bacterium RIFOXYA12_64_32]OGV85953.1 MAG: alpha-N-arabinofuranosidase [Lentisphaerae bacterium RIFOXYB12_FULL_65_16]